MMCIPDIMNPYCFAMIHGAAVALERFGYSILLEYTMHSRKGAGGSGLPERAFCGRGDFWLLRLYAGLIQAIEDMGSPR